VLNREEYVELAYFFRCMSERMRDQTPMQELFAAVRDEILATTKLPHAIDFLLSELRHSGVFATAMAKLPHYFSPLQTYIMSQAESERGRFDLRIALEILRREAEYRGESPSLQGLFLYQFEALCRNRLSYDYGMHAMSRDPAYDEKWRKWILKFRRRIGLVDVADMIYVASEHYIVQQKRMRRELPGEEHPILFGDKEGRIALANRTKNPLFLFAAMQRHLGYPEVPKPKPIDDTPHLIPQMMRMLEQLEQRIKMIEDEQRQGAVDLNRFLQDNAGRGGQ
jgi:hypothetical protein